MFYTRFVGAEEHNFGDDAMQIWKNKSCFWKHAMLKRVRNRSTEDRGLMLTWVELVIKAELLNSKDADDRLVSKKSLSQKNSSLDRHPGPVKFSKHALFVTSPRENLTNQMIFFDRN